LRQQGLFNGFTNPYYSWLKVQKLSKWSWENILKVVSAFPENKNSYFSHRDKGACRYLLQVFDFHIEIHPPEG